MVVSGIVDVFLGFAVHDWSRVAVPIMRGVHWGFYNYRLFGYLSDFAENWLKGVYMCQDDTCGIISQSDHSFNSYDQKSKCCIYVYGWMRLIRFPMKILAASDTESDFAIHCTWMLSLNLC